MKITAVQTHLPAGLLRLQTDILDLEGWCLGIDEATAKHISRCASEIIGRDPLDRERIWQVLLEMDRFKYLPHSVRGCIDVAMWDLAGKITDLPLYHLIGGFRNQLPAYKSGGNLPTVEAFVAEAETAQREGFVGYKDHCYHGPEVMMKIARATRQAVGPDFHLMHDSVQRYTYVDALRLGRVLEQEDYSWFEEPLRDFDLMGLKKLADALDIPIAASEYLPGTIHSTAQLLAHQAVDIVRASVPWRGGITDMLKIARLAEAFGVNCEITSIGIGHGFVHAHVIGSIRNCNYFEAQRTGSLGGEPAIRNPIELINGHITVPQGPGVGWNVDWAEIEKNTEQII